MGKTGIPYPISPKEKMIRETMRKEEAKKLGIKSQKLSQVNFSERIIAPQLRLFQLKPIGKQNPFGIKNVKPKKIKRR